MLGDSESKCKIERQKRQQAKNKSNRQKKATERPAGSQKAKESISQAAPKLERQHLHRCTVLKAPPL